MLEIKPHDFTHPSFLPVNEAEEMPLDKTLTETYLDSVKRNAKRAFLSYRAGLASTEAPAERFVSLTYEESAVYINALRKQISELGLYPGARIAIYAKNSPYWLMADYAIAFSGNICVTIFDTLGVDNIRYCLDLAGVEAIFTISEFLPTITGMLDALLSLKHIILLEESITDMTQRARQAAKVAAHFASGGKIVDDSHSMYSFGARTDVSQEQESDKEVLNSSAKIAEEFFTTHEAHTHGEVVRLHFVYKIDSLKPEAIEVALRSLVPPQGYKCTDINSVVFTSGTGGMPKGAIFSHRNVCAGGACLCRRFVPYSVNDAGQQSSTLSYLPLAHVFERCYEHVLAFRGFNIYYSSGSIKNIVKDLELAQISCMIGVPRVYQKIFDNFYKQLAQQSFLTRTVFKLCYNLKNIYLNASPAHYRTGKMPVVDSLAFAKIAKALGGKMEYIISGSSALPEKVYDFLRICSCARVTIGFGLTETSASGLYCFCGQHLYSSNYLGFSAAFVSARIAPVADCEYSFEQDKVGELCVKSVGVVCGYIDEKWGKIRKITDSDGYFHTGDLVRLNPDGSCTFVRRIANVVKLQHGEFVDLEAVEAALEGSPLVTCAFVHAEANRAAPVAIVCVDSGACQNRFGANVKLDDKIAELGDELVRGAGLKGFCVPHAYKVYTDVDWTADRYLFTPSQKKIYAGFRRRFAAQLHELFEKSEKAVAGVHPVKSAPSKRAGAIAAAALIAIGAILIAAFK